MDISWDTPRRENNRNNSNEEDDDIYQPLRLLELEKPTLDDLLKSKDAHEELKRVGIT